MVRLRCTSQRTQQGHITVVEALLGRGSTVNLALSDGRTPLFTAAHNGNLAMVETLLRRGAAVNQADQENRTTLFIAAQRGHLSVVEALLRRGAAVDHMMDEGATSLAIAAQRGHVAVANRLLVILDERHFARLGNVGHFRAAFEAGSLTAPIIQWLPLLPIAPRAELLTWVSSYLDDMLGLYASAHHGIEDEGEGHLRRILKVPSPITELVSLYLVLPRNASRQHLRGL